MLRKEKRKSSKKIVVEENIPSQKTTSVIVMGSINDESSNLRIIEPIPSKTIICVVAGHSHFLCLTGEFTEHSLITSIIIFSTFTNK